MAARLGRHALHGRPVELDLLQAAVERAVRGRLAVVFVEGEPGIGKTRLLAEALEGARKLGVTVVSGRAEELERTRPFAVVAQALGCVRSAPDPRRAAIASLLAPHDSGRNPITVSSDPGLQYRAVDALTDLVEELALSAPLVVALDDLQWADPSSLLTLGAMLRRLADLPIAILGSFRPVPRPAELQRVLDSLGRGGARQLSLGGLDEQAVHDLVTEALGADPGPGLMAELSGAGGNPLFVVELLGAIEQGGALRPAGNGAGVVELALPPTLPPTLRLTILRRLSFLPEDSVHALRWASILGSSFSLTELSAVTGRPAGELYKALAAALAGGVIEEDGLRLRFRHDLVRDAIYEDVPGSVRVGLHREAGRRLAATGAAALRVAEQLVRGAEPGDADAVSWLLRAAREAVSRSPEIAAELLERAVGLLDPFDPARDGLLAERAQTLLLAGRIAEAESVCRHLLERGHDPASDGPARTCLGHALLVSGRPGEALGELVQVGQFLTDSQRATAVGWESLARMWVDDLDGAVAAAGRARELAASVGDPLTVSVAYSTLELVASHRGRLEEAIRINDESLCQADASPNRQGHQYPLYITRAFSLIELGRLDQARAALETGQRVCEELGVRWPLVTYQAYSALERFAVGEWDDASAEFEASIALAGDAGDAFSLTLSLNVLALIAMHRGDLPAAEHAAAAAAPAAARNARHFAHRAAWVRALLLEGRGNTTAALAGLTQAWDECVALDSGLDLPVLGPDLARLALAAGDRDRAREVAAAVAVVAGQNHASALTGAALRCRGLAEDDADTLCSAVDAYAGSQLPLELALTSHDAAAALARRGDVKRALPLLHQAARTYETLGASRDLARLEALMRAVGVHRGRHGPRRRPQTGWASLTATELTVARLVAEGLSNPQIGERLYVSRRTVQTHLAHSFAKLDVHSRAQLAAEVVQHAANPPSSR